MPTYPVQSVRYADILRAVKVRLQSQLAASLGTDPSRVVLVKGGGYKVPFEAGSHFRVRSVRGAYFGEDGGGRIAMPVTRIIAVDVFTRSAMDPAGEDDLALTEATEGHFDREEAVAGALAIWTPLSTPIPPADPVRLTVEPLHPAEVPQDADAPDAERYNGYVVSSLYFDCRYVSKLSQ